MILIDKDMLIEILGEMQGLCYTKAALTQNSKIWKRVKDLPAVDAVPVVRCCDCKYYEETDETIGTCLLTESGAYIEGYCSWAEVKEE